MISLARAMGAAASSRTAARASPKKLRNFILMPPELEGVVTGRGAAPRCRFMRYEATQERTRGAAGAFCPALPLGS